MGEIKSNAVSSCVKRTTGIQTHASRINYQLVAKKKKCELQLLYVVNSSFSPACKKAFLAAEHVLVALSFPFVCRCHGFELGMQRRVSTTLDFPIKTPKGSDFR